MQRRDSALIEAAIDAAAVTDDFVRGVLQNAGGRAGGSEHVDRGWRRILAFGGGAVSGEKSVVKGMAGQYGGEQLRKAANAADDLVAAVDELIVSAWTAPAQRALGRLAELGVREVPEILRRPDVGPRSPEVRDAHERLSSAIAALNEARAATILAEMRAAKDQGERPYS